MSELGAEGITSQRVIELERADAMRSVIERAVKRIEDHKVKGEAYRKALKLAVRLVREALYSD